MVPKIMKQGRLTPWLYLAPALLIMLVFIVYPTLNTIQLSLKNRDGTQSAAVDCVEGEPCWSVLENYRYALTDSQMVTALRNNALWLLVMVPATVGAGDLSPTEEEAARLIEDLPNEAWRYAALDQLRRLKQLVGEGRRARVVGGEAEQEAEESEAPARGRPESV